MAITAFPFYAAVAAEAPAPAPVTITQDSATRSAVVGERFSLTSTVKNAGTEPVTGLVAHLDIVSLDPDVYVDPEDWSSNRTKYLTDVAPGDSLSLPWTVQAVSDGTFVVYVALVTPDGGSAVTNGPAVRVDVASRRTINAGGIVPVALAVPAVLVAMLVAVRYRRRRLR
jgi:hypothetical protein